MEFIGNIKELEKFYVQTVLIHRWDINDAGKASRYGR
jgi:hypothetical protein